MSDSDREKIAKLPTWARELIKRLEYANGPLLEEAVKCRREAAVAKDKANRMSTANAALMELLSKAGQARLDWAATTVSVLDGYEIFRDGGKS